MLTLTQICSMICECMYKIIPVWQCREIWMTFSLFTPNYWHFRVYGCLEKYLHCISKKSVDIQESTPAPQTKRAVLSTKALRNKTIVQSSFSRLYEEKSSNCAVNKSNVIGKINSNPQWFDFGLPFSIDILPNDAMIMFFAPLPLISNGLKTGSV